MRQKLVYLTGFLGVLVFLGVIFLAIIKLQGPRKPLTVTPDPTTQGQKGELDMSAKKLIESRSIEVSFSSGTSTLSLGSIPLLIVEKTATGTIQSIKPDLEAIKKLIATLPEPISTALAIPAELVTEGKSKIQRIKRGSSIQTIDREKTQETILAAIQSSSEPTKLLIPLITRESEGENGFDALREKHGFKVSLSGSETIHKDHLDDEGRNENLRVAAEKVDGLILKPGEEFSFNRIVGDRSRKNGFRMAGVISNGKVIPGMGGGVCQVSTSLYNAALLANLKITERYNHSIYDGIPYAERGRDAAVVYGVKDFRFKNSLSIPILISCTSAPGRVRVAFYAETKPFDKIEVVTKNEKVIPFPVQQKVKKGSKTAPKKIVRHGVTGYTIEAFRQVTLGDQVKEEKLSKDNYLMFPQIEEIAN